MILNNQHSLASDECAREAKERQNDMYNDYMSFNYFNACDARDRIRDFSVDNHLVYMDGYGSVRDCTVVDDTKIRYGWEWTNQRGNQQLPKRVFTAVPDLGRGAFNAEIETSVKQGEDTNTRKTCDNLSEASLLKYTMTPLIDCLRGSIQDPNNLVPSWTWGGENTRDTINQKAFLEQHGYAFDGNVWKKKISSCA